MKKLVVKQPGLHLDTLDAPIDMPLPDQVQVEVIAVGLNPIDGKSAQHGHPQWQYPHTPGLDAVGRITEVGSNAGNLRPGQRVIWHGALDADGALAEVVNVPAAVISAVPDEIDDLHAAALPCSAMTAWQAIERMQLTPKQTVLIEAGAGGVGYYAIQLAKKKGAKVITTASPQHHQFLGAVGADWMIDYHTQDVAEVIRETIGELDAVLDSIGGEASVRDLRLLRRGGHYVSLLGLPDLPQEDLFSIAPSIHIIGLGGAYGGGDSAAGSELPPLLEKLVTLMSEGELQSPTIERVPFEPQAVSAALERELQGRMAGKQVVTVH